MQTIIRMPDELYKQLKEEVKKRGLSVNGYIVMAMWKALESE